uniref:Uncharacterized protein n=1 Tax=Ditylenchus dipsaci TaxID=166011 RepID=A0A915DDX6_9BILA
MDKVSYVSSLAVLNVGFSNSRNISKKFADEIYCCVHSNRNRPGYFDYRACMRVRCKGSQYIVKSTPSNKWGTLAQTLQRHRPEQSSKAKRRIKG